MKYRRKTVTLIIDPVLIPELFPSEPVWSTVPRRDTAKYAKFSLLEIKMTPAKHRMSIYYEWDLYNEHHQIVDI